MSNSCWVAAMTEKLAWSIEYHIKVHAVDSYSRIILDAQINVFLDTKSKVSSFTEVPTTQLVFLHLKNREMIRTRL